MAILSRSLITAAAGLLLWPSLVLAAGVHALFDLSSPAGGPFPSDRFTVADASHHTGLRVSLPKPACDARPSDCADIDVINTLDGFNLQPRLSIPFSGPIDVASAGSHGVFLVSLGSTVPGGGRGGKVVGINQMVWDPPTHTLHVESDQLLDQHTRYALIVTRGLRDTAGDPVEAGAFARFRHDLNFGQTEDPALKAYRKALLDAVDAAARAGVHSSDIVTASVFTTQSASAVLEKIRDQIKAATPQPASFLLGGGGTRTLFTRAEVTSIAFTRQVGTAPSFSPSPVPLAALHVFPGAVGQIAFGRYLSPDYETADKFIPAVGTRSGVPAVQVMNSVYFDLFLPASPKPVHGWPVAIFGHGFGDNKDSSPWVVASTLAAHGIAAIAINVVGHGGGPLGTLTVNRAVGSPVTFFSGGRGIDQNHDGLIDSTEGSSAAPSKAIIGSRDGLRQTVVDLMQLVRVMQVGVDVDGDGVADLDSSRIYYFGQSFGGIYGTILLGVEPDLRAGVPNVPGGPIIEIVRLSPVFRPLLGIALLSRVPSLINVGGINFNENLPLRDQPPVINAVPGALEIQAVIENTEWVSQSGNPVAYAPYIRRDPLEGMTAKPVIVQFAKGDQTVPNPTTSALLRAGDLSSAATYFRNDLAFAADPATPKNPHTFLTRITTPSVAAFAIGAQQQIATFFLLDGTEIIDPDGAGPFFEVPIAPPLPEGLNFIP